MSDDKKYEAVKVDENQEDPQGKQNKVKLLNIILLGTVFMTTGSR